MSGQQHDNERPSRPLASLSSLRQHAEVAPWEGCLAIDVLIPESSAGPCTVKGHSCSIRNLAASISSVTLGLTCLQVTQESALFQANAGNAFANTFASFIAGTLQVSMARFAVVPMAERSNGLLKVAAGPSCLPQGALAEAAGAMHVLQHLN